MTMMDAAALSMHLPLAFADQVMALGQTGKQIRWFERDGVDIWLGAASRFASIQVLENGARLGRSCADV
jgi:hypothetical protein